MKTENCLTGSAPTGEAVLDIREGRSIMPAERSGQCRRGAGCNPIATVRPDQSFSFSYSFFVLDFHRREKENENEKEARKRFQSVHCEIGHVHRACGLECAGAKVQHHPM